MAWTEESANDRFTRWVTLSETLTLADPGGASETNADSSTIYFDIGDRKIIVLVEVEEASASNGNLEVRLQASVDESNWHTVDTTSALTIDTTSTSSSGTEDLDATGYDAPYWRLQPFTDGTDIGDSTDIKLTIAFSG